MACIGSSTRLCARRVHEKLLCQFGQSAPVKKKLTTYVRIKSSSSARILNNQTIAPSELAVASNSIVQIENNNKRISNTQHNGISTEDTFSSVTASLNQQPLVRWNSYNNNNINNKNNNNSNKINNRLVIDNNVIIPKRHYSSHKLNNINNNNNNTNIIINSNLWWHPRQRPEQIWTTNILCRRQNGQLPSSFGGDVVRYMSTMRSTQQPSSLPEYQVNPYRLIDEDLKEVYDDIRLLIRKNTNNEELHAIGTYYFDGQGKAFRPMVVTLMSRALNRHLNKDISFLPSQKEVSMISEMIHIASLIHDDVIDQAEFRRGKPSANVIWNHKKVAMAGDFILAVASMMIARLKNDDVTLVLSEVITDLIQGEFMQLGSKETENERFAHYLTKTYRKTASLIANSLKSVAILAQADEQTCELAYQYGRNLGLAFQLVDDMLDFVSSAEEMGKPAAADLKLGLATAPVLFACEKYPELTPMIMRRFGEPGDCERAFELVHKSQGLKQTQFLAQQHCMEAARLANTITPSPHQKGLVLITDFVLNRMK